MTARERIIKMFGGIDKVPAYLIRALGLRKQAEDRRKEELRAHKEKKEQERERVKSLRRPPALVWRVGNVIFWEPPETMDRLKPAGFWIQEHMKGAWTNHGDYLLPDVRSAQLFGSGPARVEAYYNDTALGEVYISEPVRLASGEDPHLVNKVRYYVSERGRPKVYYERWRRVLYAFGVRKGKWVRMKNVKPLGPAMTAREARSYADRGWGRWVPVADALERIERLKAKAERAK